MEFDFKAFDINPTFNQRTTLKGGWLLWAGVVGSVVLFIVWLIYFLVTKDIAGSTPFIFLALFVGGMTFVEYRVLGRAIQLTNFAAANDMVYTHDAPFDYRDGLIFREGHSQKYVDLLRADGHYFTEIGNYEYITGSGKSQQTHRYGYVRIKLPRRLPNMVLDAKSNNLFGRISNLPSSFRRDQVLHLEGNFDNYFTLYAPEEYKVDALYVFTPDVMQALIDTAGKYDCEVIDDDFYIYTQPSFNLTNRQHFEQIIAIVQTLKPELLKQSINYSDENVGNRAENTIAPAGARLRTRMSVTMIISIIFFVIYFASILYQSLPR